MVFKIGTIGRKQGILGNNNFSGSSAYYECLFGFYYYK